jgi:signal transduction histidine kinase
MEAQEIFNIVIAATVILLVLGIFIFLFFIMYQKRQRQYQKQLTAQQAEFQNTLLQTQLEIQEQTFKIISQEIHDNLGQVLSLAKLNLNTVDFSNNEKASEKIDGARQLVSKAIVDLRDLSRTLNTDTITSVGLVRAIETEMQLLEKTGTVTTHLYVQGAVKKLDPQKELILFRIVQETLHNVIKHANATSISVNADFSNSLFKLTVADNGSGFETDRQSSGSGLCNMQSRCHLISAEMKINSGKSGTEIIISLPTTF